MFTRSRRASAVLFAAVLALELPLQAPAQVITSRISPNNGHTYYLLGAPNGSGGFDGETWTAAEAQAVTLSSHLVTLNDANENAWVWSIFRPFSSVLWTGFTDAASEGNWAWVSGQSVTYTNWNPTEPNGGTSENVAWMQDPSGKWADVPASLTAYGVAETNNAFTPSSWTNPVNGTFSTAGNWTPSGAPGASGGAYFTAAGTYTVSFASSPANLLAVAQAGNVTLALSSNTYSPTELYVANLPAQNAALTLAGSSGTVATQYTTLGQQPGSAGTLTVNSGATLSASKLLFAGYQGTGTLNINGGNVSSPAGDVHIGYQGTASLAITSNGHLTASDVYIGMLAGSTGAATLSGAGSSINSTGMLVVGWSGTGSLSVGAGSSVTAGYMAVGFDPPSTGAATLTGSGASLAVSGLSEIGRNSSGSVTVSSGASFTSHDISLGGVWQGRGSLTVTGSSSTASATGGGWLTVGGDGFGSLSVSSGGLARTLGGGIVNIGNNSSGSGQVLVSGAGAQLQSSSEIWVGNSGAGSLSISSGGAVSATHLSVAFNPGSSGALGITGSSSTLTNSGDVSIGDRSTGSAVLSAGAHATTAGTLFIGREEFGNGSLSVDGAGSSWAVSQSIIVGNTGYGSLSITNGATVSTSQDLIIGNNVLVTTSGTITHTYTGTGAVTVSGAGSTLVSQWPLDIGRNAVGSLAVLDGASVTYGGTLSLAPNAGTQAFLHLSGAGSSLVSTDPNGGAHLSYSAGGAASALIENNAVWNINGELGLDSAASLTVAAGAAVHVGNYAWIGNGSSVTLAGGTITTTDSLHFDSNTPSLSGYGAISGNVNGDLDTLTATGGKLTLGSSSITNGFEVSAHSITVSPNATLELLDLDQASINNPGGGTVSLSLDNGILVGRNGIALNTDPNINPPTGYGVVVGNFSQSIANPSGTVNLSVNLDVLASPARVFSAARADLGPLTTLSGGSLVSAHGLRLQSGDVLAGFGTVSSDIRLENGILSADAVQPLNVIGTISGYGLSIGNVSAPLAPTPADGTVSLSSALDIGSRNARIYTLNPAYLGPHFTLSGGTVTAPGHAAAPDVTIPAASDISGYGNLSLRVDLAGGTLRASGGTLNVQSVSGYGWLLNSVSATTLNPASAPLSVTAAMNVGSDAASAYSSAPVTVSAPVTLSAGGSLSSAAGLLLTPVGSLAGTGTVNGAVVNNGSILPSGSGGLSFAGALSGSGSISGTAITLLPGASFTGSGTINSALSLSSGATLVPTGPLSAGKASAANAVSIAGSLAIGANSLTLLSSNAVPVTGSITLAGGSLTVPSGLTLSSAGVITGHGALSSSAFTNSGTSTFSGVTDLFAPVTVSTGGKITVTGVGPSTFYNNTVINGEVHVSQYSTAVFVGPVTGTGSFSGTGQKIFEAGSSVFAPIASLGSTVVQSAASLSTPYLRESSLSVSGAVALVANSAPTVLSSLTLNTGSSFDLANDRLILDYSGSPSAPLTSLRQALQAGTLRSSTAAADPQHRQAVAFADAAALGATTWSGIPLDSTALVTKLSWLGDANLDGRVNPDDYMLIDRSFARHLPAGSATWLNGDFNYDGSITSADYLLIDRVFLQQSGILDPALLAQRQAQFGPDYVTQLIASIPEPACLTLAATTLPLLLRRRKS